MSFSPKTLGKCRKLSTKRIDTAEKLAKEVIVNARKNESEDEIEDVPEELSPKEEEAVQALTEALEIILSRPDSDNLIQKIIPKVRTQLGTMANTSIPLKN